MDMVPRPEHLLSDVLIKTGIHTGQDLLVALQSFRPLLMVRLPAKCMSPLSCTSHLVTCSYSYLFLARCVQSQATRRGAIKLIVVDSIAHVFRGSDAALATGAKTKILFSIASLLRCEHG